MSLPEDGLVAVVKRDCPTCRLVAPVCAALAESAGHEYAVHGFKLLGCLLTLEHVGLDPTHIDPNVVGDAAMHERFGQGFVGVL